MTFECSSSPAGSVTHAKVLATTRPERSSSRPRTKSPLLAIPVARTRRRLEDARRDPMVDALIWLSEGKPIDASRRQSLVEAGPSFVRRANVGFVVVDKARTPAALREFAVQAFSLEIVGSEGAFELYTPAPPQPAH